MAIILNGSTYNNKKGLMLGGEFYTKIRLAVSLAGTAPAAGTAFSAVSLTVRAELPDVGITGAAAAAVTGYTRAAGTVAEGSNTITVSWNGISGSVTFNASGTSGGGGGEIVPDPGEGPTLVKSGYVDTVTSLAFDEDLQISEPGKTYTIIYKPETGVGQNNSLKFMNEGGTIEAMKLSAGPIAGVAISYNGAATAGATAGDYNVSGSAALIAFVLPPYEAATTELCWKAYAYGSDGSRLTVTKNNVNDNYQWINTANNEGKNPPVATTKPRSVISGVYKGTVYVYEGSVTEAGVDALAAEILG